MTALTVCSPCQMGDHSRHHRVVQAVPKGMYGGSVCTCEGECTDNRYQPVGLTRLAKHLARATQIRHSRS